MMTLIDRIEDLKGILDTVTCEQLRHKYGTGRSFTIVTPQEKKSRYRKGVMTEIGDIEESVWMQAMEYIIKRDNEIELHKNLREFVKDNYIGWFKTDMELAFYALQLHSSRIFDSPQWISYIKFNQKYRPGIFGKKI